MNSLIALLIGLVIIHIGIYILSIVFTRKIVKLSRLGIVALEMIVLPVAALLFLEASKGYLIFTLIFVVLGTCLLSFNIIKQILNKTV